MNKNILLGSFSQANFGDDWILNDAMKKWETNRICSKGLIPKKCNFSFSFLKNIILPGGGLFQDRTSNASFYWYFFMVLVSRKAKAYDMDLTELKSPFKKFLLNFLINLKFDFFELRPATSFLKLKQGLDSVCLPCINDSIRQGVVWCPYPADQFIPALADSVFISDKRNYFCNFSDFNYFYHQTEDIKKSFIFLSRKDAIISSRYHPLLLAWMNGQKGLGIGPQGGKIHHLCKRAGFPYSSSNEDLPKPQFANSKWI